MIGEQVLARTRMTRGRRRGTAVRSVSVLTRCRPRACIVLPLVAAAHCDVACALFAKRLGDRPIGRQVVWRQCWNACVYLGAPAMGLLTRRSIEATSATMPGDNADDDMMRDDCARIELGRFVIVGVVIRLAALCSGRAVHQISSRHGFLLSMAMVRRVGQNQTDGIQ